MNEIVEIGFSDLPSAEVFDMNRYYKFLNELLDNRALVAMPLPRRDDWTACVEET